MKITVHTIPFSTNAERVAVAAAFKGIEIDWITHRPDDRDEIIQLSGQALVPVAVIGTDVVVDSIEIIERLEHLQPEPPLWPTDPERRAAVEIYVEWFNGVWKGPPNAINDGHGDPSGALSGQISAWTARFEDILNTHPYLLGDELTIADITTYPFLRYTVDHPHPDDTDSFHQVLFEQLSPGQHPAIEAWVHRLEEIGQA